MFSAYGRTASARKRLACIPFVPFVFSCHSCLFSSGIQQTAGWKNAIPPYAPESKSVFSAPPPAPNAIPRDIHGDSVGDGREEARESTPAGLAHSRHPALPHSQETRREEENALSPSPHGEVNAANAAMWGGWRIACSSAIRREGRTAPPPASVLNPNPFLVHPLRRKRSDRR